jgi:hypothetical protein
VLPNGNVGPRSIWCDTNIPSRRLILNRVTFTGVDGKNLVLARPELDNETFFAIGWHLATDCFTVLVPYGGADGRSDTELTIFGKDDACYPARR